MKVRADSSRSMSCFACWAMRCRSTVRPCTRRPQAASPPGGHGPAAWAAAMTRLRWLSSTAPIIALRARLGPYHLDDGALHRFLLLSGLVFGGPGRLPEGVRTGAAAAQDRRRT